MRRLFFSLLMFCVLPAWADGHDQLYKVAGWAEQRAHFNDALAAAQQRYRNSLPPAVYQALVDNSNQRFAAQAMDQRAEAQLRKHLADPAPALAFFQSPLGRKIVAAELLATRRDQLAKNAPPKVNWRPRRSDGGLPRRFARASGVTISSGWSRARWWPAITTWS